MRRNNEKSYTRPSVTLRTDRFVPGIYICFATLRESEPRMAPAQSTAAAVLYWRRRELVVSSKLLNTAASQSAALRRGPGFAQALSQTSRSVTAGLSYPCRASLPGHPFPLPVPASFTQNAPDRWLLKRTLDRSRPDPERDRGRCWVVWVPIPPGSRSTGLVDDPGVGE